MKIVNLNSYMINCYLLIGVIILFMNKFEYNLEWEEYLIYAIGGLIFTPFELYCSKIMYYIMRKENFQTKYFFSERIITVK